MNLYFELIRRRPLLILFLLNTFGFLYYIYFLILNGYLPSPFPNYKFDTFMDLFNPMYWAYDIGRYSEWLSVYPPINFIFLRALKFICGGATFGSPLDIRDESPTVIYIFISIYLVSVINLLRYERWGVFNIKEKLLLFFIIVFSSPMLFALERGNLIILSLFFLPIVIKNDGFLRDLSIGILINIKPYFVILMLFYLIRKRFDSLATCSLIAGGIFLITGLCFDSDYFLFFTNILSFSNNDNLFSLREITALPSSITVFSYVLEAKDGFEIGVKYLGEGVVYFLIRLIPFTNYIALSILTFSLVKKAPSLTDDELFAGILVLITNLGIWVGGYSVIIYVVLIPIFWNSTLLRSALILMALIFIPVDLISLTGNYIGDQISFFTGLKEPIYWTFTLGSIVRPISNFILMITISYSILSANRFSHKARI